MFPIDTATACQFKWTWSVLYLHRGTTNSCHRCKRFKLDPNNFDSFHNLPEKLNDRKKMLQGEWPGNGCEYCKSVEDAGGMSERKTYTNNMDLVPPELSSDINSINVTPRVLEVYFKNLCNLSCVYCSPINSSVIEAEYRRFGPIANMPQYGIDDGVSNTDWNPELHTHLFWEWMEKNSNELRIFNVLGGEPLYQKEFDQCLEFFDTHPNSLLTFGVFSNLQHNPEVFRKKIDKANNLVKEGKIKKFEIICSIDCWGKESEFVRMGLDLETWETNFKTLVNSDHVSIHVHMSATPMSVFTAADLVKKVYSYRRDDRWIGLSMNTVVKPHCVSPYIFGYYLAPYLEPMLDIIGGTKHDNEVFRTLTEGIINKMKNTEPDIKQINSFVKYMDALDLRRKKNWREVFPVLADLSKKLLDE
jgi:hypothetical protein